MYRITVVNPTKCISQAKEHIILLYLLVVRDIQYNNQMALLMATLDHFGVSLKYYSGAS